MSLLSTVIDPKLIEMDGAAIAPLKNKVNGDQNDFKLDRDWARSAFLISDSQLTDTDDVRNRYWSSAAAKFTDTRLGCNIGINSRPQFTRYSDVRVRGRLANRNNVSLTQTSGNIGMGRYYSEAIDDPSQNIYLRFGVPQFNSLTNFLAKAFDPDQSSLARTGRGVRAFYELGVFAGTVAAFVYFPAAATIILTGKVIGYFFRRPTSKFYTLKPTMPLYWATVDNLVKVLTVNRGILPKVMTENQDKQRLGQPFEIDQEYLSAIHQALPDVFGTQNVFDVYAISNKAQRIANQLFLQDYKDLDQASATNFTGYLKKEFSGDGTHGSYISDKKGDASLQAIIAKMLKFSAYYGTDNAKERTEIDPRVDKKSKDGSEKKEPTWWEEYKSFFSAELDDGSQYAIFKVDHTGQISESFSNSVAESDISQKLNGLSSQMRQAKFSFANGNLDDGVIAKTIGGAITAVGDLAKGALSGITMGFSDFILGLGGNGYVDIPKNWQSSTANLPRNNYTIQLVSPYGNPISQLQNIYIPLCMLLAAALPLSTGKQSYTSPFLCQLFDRGRCQIRLGMIESLSITRGTTNLPFDTKGNALALDVSFSIVDLSTVMHMPISSGSFSEVDMTLDEDNILSDYLAVLAGQDLYSQTYAIPKAKLVAAKTLANASKFTSPAYWATMTHGSLHDGFLNSITLGAAGAITSVIEGAARGNENLLGSVK